MNYKADLETSSDLLYGVAKVPQQEPYDRKILQQLTNECNIYCKLVLLLKLDTQTYYIIRIILDLEEF